MPGFQSCNLPIRSEEHTSELQSQSHLVCRLLLVKLHRAGTVVSRRHHVRGSVYHNHDRCRDPGWAFLASVFFKDTATTEIYTLSLHDALPICLNSSHTLISYAVFCLRDESVTGVQ